MVSADEWQRKGSVLRLPSDAMTIDMRLPNVTVPTALTTYTCMFVIPPNATKYHLYKAEPLGDPEVIMRMVHHFSVHAVYADNIDHPIGEPFDCTDFEGSGRGVAFTGYEKRNILGPDWLTYQEMDAALPMGKGYSPYWVSERPID